MNQFDVIEAAFNPKRMDDLAEGARNLIGKKFKWQVCFKIEYGQFEGQWGMALLNNLGYDPPFAWAPECDLEIEKCP